MPENVPGLFLRRGKLYQLYQQAINKLYQQTV